MQGVLETEIKRLTDILLSLRNHVSFDAYINKKERDIFHVRYILFCDATI